MPAAAGAFRIVREVSVQLCYFSTLVVAWSLADLAGLTRPGIEEVKTAMGFRLMAAGR